MKELLPYGELILLIILTLLQAGRWSQKQEASPESTAKGLLSLEAEVRKNYDEFRRHRHEWNNYLQTVDYRNDQRYVRRDIYEVEKTSIKEKQEADEERLTEIENWRNKTMGIV